MVLNRVAGWLEMIYSTRGCAARQGVQSASRAYSPVRAPPERRALIALSAEHMFVTQMHARIRRDAHKQLQCPPDPDSRRQVLHLLFPRRGREERSERRLEAALLHEGA